MAPEQGPMKSKDRPATRYEFEHDRDHDDDARSMPDYEDASPEEIEADIRRTRAEMDQTLAELQDRLSPRNIWHDVMGMFRSKKAKSGHADSGQQHHDGGAGDKAKKIGRRVLQTVRDHPVPAVLVTTAVTTLIYESASRRSSRKRNIRSINIYRGEPTMYGGSHVHAQSGEPYYGQSGEHRGQQRFEFEGSRGSHGSHDEPGMMQQAREKMADAGESVRSGVQHASEAVGSGVHKAGQAMRSGAHQLSEGASHMGEKVKHGMDNTKQFIEERPLTVGIAALATGLLVGLLIPRTQREDRLMGEPSRQFIERSKEVGEDVLERGKHVAEEAMEAATEAATKESERQGLKPD